MVDKLADHLHIAMIFSHTNTSPLQFDDEVTFKSFIFTIDHAAGFWYRYLASSFSFKLTIYLVAEFHSSFHVDFFSSISTIDLSVNCQYFGLPGLSQADPVTD